MRGSVSYLSNLRILLLPPSLAYCDLGAEIYGLLGHTLHRKVADKN